MVWGKKLILSPLEQSIVGVCQIPEDVCWLDLERAWIDPQGNFDLLSTNINIHFQSKR